MMSDFVGKKSYDVIVVGGGFSGCAAALAAARGGCSVLLCEQYGALGGAAINNLVLPFMPWYTNIVNNDGKTERFYLSRGIFTEICNELKKYGALENGCFNEEYLKIVLDRMLAAAGVNVLFHATLCDVFTENYEITSLSVVTKAGKLNFAAKCYIDCTGDADLAVMSGCPFRLGRPADALCQPMTLCFRVANVDTALFFTAESREKMQAIYKDWQECGKTSDPRENLLVFRTLIDGVVHFNSTRIVKKNPVDPFDVSYAEAEGRKQMLEIFTMLKDELPAFKNAQLLESSIAIGARESRMIDGEHILNELELKNCTHFDDAIAAGNYDIDIHSPDGAGTAHYYFKDGEYYTIPYRCLQPKGINNLLVAGRCCSVTHEAQASIRIMPIVCCLGEAAGTGAAAAVKSGVGVKNVNITEIQRILKRNGAFFG